MAFGNILSGAAGGGLSGASIGSMIAPGIGTAIGGGLGALFGGIGSAFGGDSAEQQVPIQRYTPEQLKLMNQLGQQGTSGLQGILNNPLDSKAMEEEAMRQYNQQIVPNLMSRLTAAPTAGLQRSSAFGQTLGAAGGDLATRLAALRSEVAMQQQNMRAGIYGNMLNAGLGQQFEPGIRPAEQGFGSQLLSASAPLLQGMGQYGASRFSDWLNKPKGSSFSTGSGLPNVNDSQEAQWLKSFNPGSFSAMGGF